MNGMRWCKIKTASFMPSKDKIGYLKLEFYDISKLELKNEGVPLTSACSTCQREKV
jgi:hypothetical protein